MSKKSLEQTELEQERVLLLEKIMTAREKDSKAPNRQGNSEAYKRSGSTAEQDSYNQFRSVLTRVTTASFSVIDQQDSNEQAEVNLCLNDQVICLNIHKQETFNDLALRAQSFWGVPAKRIFFSSRMDGCIYLGSQRVCDEVYTWRGVRLKNRPNMLYVVLGNFDSLEDLFYEPSSNEEPSPELTTSRQLMNKEAGPSSEQRMRNRMRKHLLLTVLQLLALLALIGLWFSSIASELDIFKSCWANQVYHSTFYGDLDDRQDLSLYPSVSSEKFLHVNGEWSFWAFLKSVHSILYTTEMEQPVPGSIRSFNYVYQAVGLRQVRSNLYYCDSPLGDEALCLRKFSIDESTETYSAETEGFVYDDEGSSEFLLGVIDIYPLDGFKASLSVTDHSAWVLQVLELISNNWVDHQTRAVFITFNMVNPSIGTVSVVTNILEIGPNGKVIPNYKIQSLNYASLQTQNMIIHGIIVFLILVMGSLELRNNLLCLQEIRYFEERALPARRRHYPADEVLLEKWEDHEKKRWTRKLRRPCGMELVKITALFATLAIEIVTLIWVAHAMGSTEVSDEEYTNLLGISQAFTIITDFRLLVFIVLVCTVGCYIMLWTRFLNEYYVALVDAIAETYQLIVLFFVSVFLVALLLFYMIGPYSYMYTRIDYAFFTVLKLLLGGFTIDYAVFEYVGILALETPIIVYRMLVFLMLSIFASHLHMKLAELRSATEAKSCKKS